MSGGLSACSRACKAIRLAVAALLLTDIVRIACTRHLPGLFATQEQLQPRTALLSRTVGSVGFWRKMCLKSRVQIGFVAERQLGHPAAEDADKTVGCAS